MNEQQPDEDDLRMARQFMANPAHLETALAKITSVTGEKVPPDADERTVALAINRFRKCLQRAYGG